MKDGAHTHGNSGGGVSFSLILALVVILIVIASAAAITAVINALITLLITLCITIGVIAITGTAGLIYFHKIVEPRRAMRPPPWARGIPDRRVLEYVEDMDVTSAYPAALTEREVAQNWFKITDREWAMLRAQRRGYCTINYPHRATECNGTHDH